MAIQYISYQNLQVMLDEIKKNIMNHSDIKHSICPHCSANLPLAKVDDNGICTCEYCGSSVYVY